jgi:hypothetical protein
MTTIKIKPVGLSTSSGSNGDQTETPAARTTQVVNGEVFVQHAPLTVRQRVGDTTYILPPHAREGE